MSVLFSISVPQFSVNMFASLNVNLNLSVFEPSLSKSDFSLKNVDFFFLFDAEGKS